MPDDLTTIALSLLHEKQTNPLRFYRPHAKQREFHELKTRLKFYIGGNGSGKTFGGLQEFLMAVKGCHWVKGMYPPPPLDARICAEKQALVGVGDQSSNIIPQLKVLLRNDLVPGYPKKNNTPYESVWLLKNGSSFDIMVFAQDDDKFESVSKDLIWFDEPFRESIYKASSARMRKGSGGRMIFTLTFLNGAAWMYDRFIANPDESTGVVECNTWDNCVENGGYLTREAIEGMEREMDEEERIARIQGKPMILKNITFPIFTPDVHIIDPLTKQDVIDRKMQLYAGLDPHSARPAAWGLIGVERQGNEDVFYVLDEWPNYFDGAFKGIFYDKIRSQDFTFPQLVQLLHEREQRFGGNVVKRFIDPRFSKGNLANTNRTVMQELHSAAEELGIDMRFRPAKTGGDMDEAEVQSGLQIIRDLMAFDKSRPFGNDNHPRWYVGSNCANHVRMFQYLRYKIESGKVLENKLKTEKLQEKFKDFSDVDRYIVKGVRKWKESDTPLYKQYTYTPLNPLTGY